ncbi:MAG: hemerythrin family protein [Alphaproteobacteria bacterium]|nr:hemerythrin family protein [Alphaproteobacteria bacterium]
MVIAWNEGAFCLGIEDIDADHKKKIEAINKVEDLIDSRAASTIIATALQELIDGTASHFAREEDLMRRTKYPALANHAELHAEFLDRLGQLHAASFKDEAQIDARAELDFFADWMAVHIQNADRNYMHWLKPEL